MSEGLMTEVDTQPVVADAANIRERVVVSPCSGRFHPLPPESFTTEGEWVEPGQVLAEVHNADTVVEVRSAFRGWVMGMLALDGQPVKDGDALLWIWSA
ncbi:MAG: biotin/lipoyl-containing protein [Actinomycetota bacterium]